MSRILSIAHTAHFHEFEPVADIFERTMVCLRKKESTFNVFTTYLECFNSDLFYVNPMEMLKFLKSDLTANVVMSFLHYRTE